MLGHRKAFTWMDEWFGKLVVLHCGFTIFLQTLCFLSRRTRLFLQGMTMEDIRAYEKNMYDKTNDKVGMAGDGAAAPSTAV